MSTTPTFRPGPIGSLADEYEKALTELKSLLANMPPGDFLTVFEPGLEEDFQSVRNQLRHTVRAGYVYADHIRKRFGNPVENHDFGMETAEDAVRQLDRMFQYTLDTFEDKWTLTDDDLMNTLIKTSWTVYDLEALIEHAIVHILRHRRQIQKLLFQHSSFDTKTA